MFNDKHMYDSEISEFDLDAMEDWLIAQPNEIEHLQEMSSLLTH